MGLILILIGVLVWLLAGWFAIGLALIILGIILLFMPWPGAYGYGWYRGRRGPP